MKGRWRDGGGAVEERWRSGEVEIVREGTGRGARGMGIARGDKRDLMFAW